MANGHLDVGLGRLVPWKPTAAAEYSATPPAQNARTAATLFPLRRILPDGKGLKKLSCNVVFGRVWPKDVCQTPWQPMAFLEKLAKFWPEAAECH
jgi:hypothetical protein